MHVLRKAILAAACTAGLAAATTPALAQTTLRAVLESAVERSDSGRVQGLFDQSAGKDCGSSAGGAKPGIPSLIPGKK